MHYKYVLSLLLLLSYGIHASSIEPPQQQSDSPQEKIATAIARLCVFDFIKEQNLPKNEFNEYEQRIKTANIQELESIVGEFSS